MRRLPALLLALTLAGPAAAAVCVAPVADGQPTAEPELSQPYRMVGETLIVPGYPHLIIAPTNRGGLWTISAGRFVPLEADFPRAGLWQYRDIEILPDERVIGVGRNPRLIHELDRATGVFRLRTDIGEVWRAGLDAGSGVYRYVTRDGALWDLPPTGPVRSSLPVFDGIADVNATLPRFVPALGGYLAASEDSLHFLAEGAAGWNRLSGFGEDDALWQIATAPILESPELNLVHLGFGQHIASLDTAGDMPQLAYWTRWANAPVAAGGRVLFEQVNHRRTWLGRVDTRRRDWPDLMVLGRDGPVPVPGLPAEVMQDGSPTVAYSIVPLPERNLAMVWINGARMAFDGTTLRPMPEAAILPRYVWRARFGNRILLRDTTTLFEADAEGVFRQIVLPSGDTPFELFGSRALGGALLAAPALRRAWLTRDLVSFDEIALPPDTVLEKVQTDLPDGSAALAVGTGGLYLLTRCKEDTP